MSLSPLSSTLTPIFPLCPQDKSVANALEAGLYLAPHII